MASLGLDPAIAGQLVTFGITPDRPETGYDYLQLARPLSDNGAPPDLVRLVEKPDLAHACDLLAGAMHRL